jgi:RimJ/RimL family protein N-acetyltransferase
MVRDFLITEKNAKRVQAVVEPSNAASIKVLEKCGYQNEGLLRRFYPSLDRDLIDVHMYAYLAE